MQTSIPCLFMRGGTSRGPFFLETDLPPDVETRDRVLLAAMGSPDRRQIDGLGGAHPLTSKVGIVRRSHTPGVDLDFLFAQVVVDQALVDTTLNCGNMLAAVVPFALETGLLRAQGDTTSAARADAQYRHAERHHRADARWTGQLCREARIDGRPGTSAPIRISFLDTAGSVCSGLLPTGHVLDEIAVDGVGSLQVTCIDNGMPLVMLRAADLQRTGYETVAELNADTELKTKVEDLRLKAGVLMGLGDVSKKNLSQDVPDRSA